MKTVTFKNLTPTFMAALIGQSNPLGKMEFGGSLEKGKACTLTFTDLTDEQFVQVSTWAESMGKSSHMEVVETSSILDDLDLAYVLVGSLVNCLKTAFQIETLRELVSKTEGDIRRNGFGDSKVTRIKDCIEPLGLKLGMTAEEIVIWEPSTKLKRLMKVI